MGILKIGQLIVFGGLSFLNVGYLGTQVLYLRFSWLLGGIGILQFFHAPEFQLQELQANLQAYMFHLSTKSRIG
ncbi:hypothetical protein LguiB_027989 [Lonicera macranthoides]